MDIETLKIFCDVIKLRGFTQAAAANSLTQSAVSQRLKNLEKEFGLCLIDRHGTELHLTRAGEVVYKGAMRILADLRDVQEQLQEIGGKVGGSVRVAAIYSVGLYQLDPFVKSFLTNYPEIDVQIEYSRANKIYEDLINGSIDLGIVAFPGHKPQLRSIPFKEDELVLICSPEHPFAQFESISLKALSSQPLIAFQRDVPTRKVMTEILKEHGVVVNIKAEFDNIELIKRAVEIGLGIAVVPLTTIKTETKAGILKAMPFVEGPFKRPISLLYRRGKSLSLAARKFVAILTERDEQEVSRSTASSPL
ncbi:MAG: LysR family transcriptional regulator [Deltaproteobacteria bacterium]|nr:LysR family transcriptional regulator [Deltaproteobacteria bacterium]